MTSGEGKWAMDLRARGRGALGLAEVDIVDSTTMNTNPTVNALQQLGEESLLPRRYWSLRKTSQHYYRSFGLSIVNTSR